MEVKQIIYEGKPCKRCGDKTRYIKGNRCRSCTLERAEIRRLGESTEGFSPRPDVYAVHQKPLDNVTFEGKPCRTCGSTTRYTLCKKCVACRSQYARNRRKKRKEINE